MTLTITDLSAIEKIVSKTVESTVPQIVKKTVPKIVEETVSKIVKSSERRIIKRMDDMDKYLDRGHMALVKRVDRIESHLGIASITN